MTSSVITRMPRRWIERQKPHGVDAEAFDVIEALDEAGEVADAVARRVLKGLDVKLIDDRILVPVGYGAVDLPLSRNLRFRRRVHAKLLIQRAARSRRVFPGGQATCAGPCPASGTTARLSDPRPRLRHHPADQTPRAALRNVHPAGYADQD